MCCARKTETVRRSFRCALLLVTGVFMMAAFVDLPSSVASRIKRIDTALVAVDTALDADRLTTAQRKLNEANRYHKEIRDRYAGKFDENDPVYVAMQERLAAANERVAAAEKAKQDADSAGQEAKAANEALCNEWIDRLSPFIEYKSDAFLPIGSELNRRSPEEQAKAMAAYPRARSLFDELQQVDFPLGKSSTLKNIESRLASSLKYYGEMEAKAAQEEACREWVEQLAPYVDSGRRSRKWLIASPTVNPEQIAQQQVLFEEATMVIEAYRQAEFPLGKTFKLQQLEASMEKALAAFPDAMGQSQAMISGDVSSRLDHVWRFMNRDTGWVDDEQKKPPVIMERDLTPLREAVDTYASNVSANDPNLIDLRANLSRLEELNVRHRRIRAERTFQYEDAYDGTDIESLRERARRIAAKAYPNGEFFHVTVPSEEWAIENVLEFTDTTKTALRRRITRSVRAQISLRDADGHFWLQEIYLGQDRLPDGDWAKLKGHTTWADPMIEDNIGELIPYPEEEAG